MKGIFVALVTQMDIDVLALKSRQTVDFSQLLAKQRCVVL